MTLTPTQRTVMKFFQDRAYNGKPTCAADVMRYLGVAHQTAAEHLEKLAVKGCLVREPGGAKYHMPTRCPTCHAQLGAGGKVTDNRIVTF